MPEVQILLTGLAFGESPRWHDGRLWFADWRAQEIIAVNLEGKSEVIVKVSFPSFPVCFLSVPFFIQYTCHFFFLRLSTENSQALSAHDNVQA